MRLAHVEIIQPHERLAPPLGSGYLPPQQPVTLADVDRAIDAAIGSGATVDGFFVVKVSRESVNWKKPANTRRLKFTDGTRDCVVIGSTMDWWFVCVWKP